MRKGHNINIIAPNEENIISILNNVYNKMYCAIITANEADKFN